MRSEKALPQVQAISLTTILTTSNFLYYRFKLIFRIDYGGSQENDQNLCFLCHFAMVNILLECCKYKGSLNASS